MSNYEDVLMAEPNIYLQRYEGRPLFKDLRVNNDGTATAKNKWSLFHL